MNQNNLQQIFSHYTENFEYVNNPDHDENYKWQVVKQFQILMNEALSANTKDFADTLCKAKTSTRNIIDSYTQPFQGLVEFARKEPETVREMFQDLYADDGGDLKKQERQIAGFFMKSNELLDKYTPGSYRFKQNSHSVSAYLFLRDPDHHYMYKATQSLILADCIGFLDDWGTGDNIKLDVFYRMCDELLEEIKKNDALIRTNESRFDGRFRVKPEDMFPDKEKHLLMFDITYCSSVYHLFDGIAFERPKTKEKQLYAERKKKAQQLLEDYNDAVSQEEKLTEALNYYTESFKDGSEIDHKIYGKGIVKSIDAKYIVIEFPDQEKKLGLPIAVAKGIISIDTDDFRMKHMKYVPVLERADSISRAVERAKNALKGYEDYLD